MLVGAEGMHAFVAVAVTITIANYYPLFSCSFAVAMAVTEGGVGDDHD